MMHSEGRGSRWQRRLSSCLALFALYAFACGGRVIDDAGGESGQGGSAKSSLDPHAGSAATAGQNSEGTSGVAGTPVRCGARRCDSNLDNNCDGVPDLREAACMVCTLGASVACKAAGLCAGTQTCVLSPDKASVQFGPCEGDEVTAEACGPVQADGVTVTPDSNCNGLNGDGDYLMTGSPCAPTATSFGPQSVHLFATPEPGTGPLYSCASRCPVGATGTFSYYSLSPCVPGATQTVLGYAALNPMPNYVAVMIPASGCTARGTYVTSYQISVPEFTFYALPSP